MTQKQALDIMKTGVNVYLTGSAGSGKTHTLNQYIQYLNEHSIPVAITASTGIASTHMNGQTIHGWSGIGIKTTLDEYALDELETKQYLWKRFEKTKVLIIDEVSMLHGYTIDMVDQVCRRFKRNELPFGGIQVILSGDFFQLPPVTRASSYSPVSASASMAWNSRAWKAMNLAVCYLTEQHRQEDDALLSILNAIRTGTVTPEHYTLLETRLHQEISKGKTPLKLYTHNINVDNENHIFLSKIEGKEYIYHMTATGPDKLVEILKRSCIAEETLRLKIGAEVMFIKNNFDMGYVNGTRGVVVDFLDDDIKTPIVRLHNNNKTIYVTTDTWAIEENNKVMASITQMPLRLAWAITIHKSQGMSLDDALIDLSAAFGYGMGYVALSRVRTLSGIHLAGIKKESLDVDEDVFLFDETLQQESEINVRMFTALTKQELATLQEQCILRFGGTIKKSKVVHDKTRAVTKIPTIQITKELVEEKKSISEMAKIRDCTEGTIVGHIEDIVKKYPDVDISYLAPKKKDITFIKKYAALLKGEQEGKLSPLKTLLSEHGHDMTFETIRLAKLFF